MVVNKLYLIPVCMLMLLGFVFIFKSPVQVYSAPMATNVKQFYPTGLRNIPAQRGNCWETSLAAPRLDAWRCIVTDTIYDPCFSSPNYANYVICDASPATDALGIKVMLTDALPKSTATLADHQSWTLRLADGVVCTFLTGTTPIIDNLRVNYGCTNNAVVAGNPTAGSIWTVREALPGSNILVTRQVIDAWT